MIFIDFQDANFFCITNNWSTGIEGETQQFPGVLEEFFIIFPWNQKPGGETKLLKIWTSLTSPLPSSLKSKNESQLQHGIRLSDRCRPTATP